MAFESHIFSGVCKYKDIDFTFMFDGEELRLIPPDDKRWTIRMEWIMTKVGKGTYTMEYVLYAMQLNYYGIDITNIRHAINDLFHLNYAIE